MKFLNFKLMVSPFLLKVVYIIGALSITIGSFVIMFGGGAFGASKGGTVPGLGILIFGNLFYRIIIELTDGKREAQVIEFSQAVPASTVGIELLAVYKGSRWSDTCMSQLIITGREVIPEVDN